MSEIQRYHDTSWPNPSPEKCDEGEEKYGIWVLYDDHLAQLRALEQRQAWQPIESAPKDGTEVYIYPDADGKVAHAEYDDSSGYWFRVGAGKMFGAKPKFWQPMQPMPLPPAPSAEGETCKRCNGTGRGPLMKHLFGNAGILIRRAGGFEEGSNNTILCSFKLVNQ